ncbi:MAG: RluA family pseudouridine synthase [Lachnospiraceae bacterium]|nr:RluA family pseudouridine synthase [Lachnospiraceae bacterium]
MELIKLPVLSEYDGERVDKVIAGEADTLSRSFVQKIIKSGEVTVDGKVVKPGYKVSEGEEILFSIPESIEPDIPAQDIPLDILYEDADVLVVNKPKGMVVHPAAGHYTDTLVNALMFHCKKQLSGINGILRPGIVHRIDKDTTGALIVCKNDAAHQNISAQLKEHSVRRRYRAIVHGVIKEESGTVNAPIGRDPSDRKKMCAGCRNGKNAVTHFQVLKRLKGYTYIECSLETGRTHQIRVHLASMGFPIVNDPLYGQKDPHFKHMGLWAKEICYIQPLTKERILIQDKDRDLSKGEE